MDGFPFGRRRPPTDGGFSSLIYYAAPLARFYAGLCGVPYVLNVEPHLPISAQPLELLTSKPLGLRLSGASSELPGRWRLGGV
jgi:hypothetical protein